MDTTRDQERARGKKRSERGRIARHDHTLHASTTSNAKIQAEAPAHQSQRNQTGQDATSNRCTTNDTRIGQAVNVVGGDNSGSITQIVYHQRPDLHAMLNPILDASHTRNLILSPPNSRCFPGTRKMVLKKIRKWVNRSVIRNHPHIIWVYGYAGCGKSAIAHAVCSHFAEQGRLAAAFFFFRGAGDRSNIARFATTIASQVAAAIPAAAPLIKAAIKANPGLLATTKTSLGDQFDQLIYQPIDKSVGLAAVVFREPFIIALDGLDECEDHEDVAAFIERMIAFFEKKPFIPLRFLITSRVENHIHNRLHSSMQVELLNLVDHTSDADILTALEAAIDLERPGLERACAASWPSVEEKAMLVKHIGGSYIFLNTILRLLFDPYTKDKLTPMERLPLILSMQPDFDGLYRAILEPSRGLPHFQDIISAIALAQEPLSIAQIADLFDIKPTKVANVLITLHAIMQVPGDDRTPVTLWHTSLRDFICTRERAGIFLANRRSMAYWCLSSACRSTSSASSSISHYATHFTLFHWEEYLRIESEGGEADPSTIRALETFLEHPFKDDFTPLEAAVQSRNWMVVHALAATNADVNVRFKQRRTGYICALQAACSYKQEALSYLLLDRGADPNIVSRALDYASGTPLIIAAVHGNVKLATRLLECGADPNLQAQLGDYYETALREACKSGSFEIVHLLLNHGADPNLRDNEYNMSALHACAARRGSRSCAQALLMRKADPNLQDRLGRTALHVTCLRGTIEVAECLLEFKADASIKDHEGWTALQFAQERNHEDMVQVLRRYGVVEEL